MSSRYGIPLHDRFVPVPVRARVDGWTVERQRGFILALTQGLSVPAAAERVGMSARSAYRLHGRTHARSFRLAWATAQSLCEPEWVAPKPLWRIVTRRWRGRVVGREMRWNEAAVCRTLARHDSRRRHARGDPAAELARERAELDRLRAAAGLFRCEVLKPPSQAILQDREVCDLSGPRPGGGNGVAASIPRAAAAANARAPPRTAAHGRLRQAPG